jgi:hypothetical protein
VRELVWTDEPTVTVTLAEGGLFVAYSAKRPTAVEAAHAPMAFDYDATTRALRVALPSQGRLTLSVRF